MKPTDSSYEFDVEVTPHAPDLYDFSSIAEGIEGFDAVDEAQLARYLAGMRAVDAVPYVGRARVPLLFQFGRRDAMPRAWLAAHASAAPAAKTVRWYDAPHELCDGATRDRKAWLLARLNPR